MTPPPGPQIDKTFAAVSKCDCSHPVVLVENLSFSYDDGFVLEDVNLHLDDGVFLGILGPNGGGKSTLLRLICGELPPTSGKVFLWGKRVPSDESRRLIGYVPQRHRGDWEFPATVREVILMGAVNNRDWLGRLPDETIEIYHLLVKMVDLTEETDQPLGKLSGGKQQRAFIARALINRPKLLLLDEPTTGIDAAGRERFIQLIIQLKKTFGLTVVMVSHDIHQLTRFTDRVACLNRRIHWHDRADLLSDDIIQDIYGCELQSIQNHDRGGDQLSKPAALETT